MAQLVAKGPSLGLSNQDLVDTQSTGTTTIKQLPERRSSTSSSSSSLSSSSSSSSNHLTTNDCSRWASLAPQFKYRENFDQAEIDELRCCLADHRARQAHSDPEALQFNKPDFERMLTDDWLASRFLFRGAKLGRKLGKPLIETTLGLIDECAKFRRQFNVNSSSGLTDQFPASWIDVQGLIAQGHDRSGNVTLYMRVKLHRKQLIDTPQLRHQFKELLLFTLEQADRKLWSQTGRGICCVFDMSQASLENVDIELISWMVSSFKSCSPKLLAYVIIYNLPWFLSAAFKLVSSRLALGGKSVRFVYGNELLSYVDLDQLPDYLATSLAS